MSELTTCQQENESCDYAKLKTLVAKQAAVIEQQRDFIYRIKRQLNIYGKWHEEAEELLNLKPCPEVLNKVRSDAVRRCAERMPHFDGEGSVQQLMWLCEEAQRIEQGGA